MSTVKNFDWSQFTLNISARAEMQSAYNAFAIPSALEQWLVRRAQVSIAYAILKGRNDFVEEGDCYEWIAEEDGRANVMRGEILEANGKNFLRFTLNENYILTITVRKENGRSCIELFFKNISVNEELLITNYMKCLKEWTFHLANLKSFLEGGIDLRNKNVIAIRQPGSIQPEVINLS